MATGFSVLDALNKNSKAGVEQSETPRARFRTRDISIYKMYRNEMNFYSVEDVETLAGEILMYGLKQNLEVVYAPCDKGEYRIVAGERRWEALKLLVARGYKEFEIATSKLTAPQDDDEEQVEIILANAYRSKTITDLMEEEARLKASLARMKKAGKKIKGYDIQSGRLRDVIADMLHTSSTKIAQLETVNKNLIPEFREELQSERLTFSAAYELSGMDETEQKKAYQILEETGELTHKEVRDMKEGKDISRQDEPEAIEAESVEADVMQQDRTVETEYETPHPEGITSICYSCTEYETCNVKTSTCTKCDQYKNRKEAYKTDEKRYEEEQDAIDRQTKKKLREQEDAERMEHLPSSEQKIHDVKIGTTFYSDVVSGRKTFELRKNDRHYKVGDVICLHEYDEGRETGDSAYVDVIYILEDFEGLKEGYCILGIANARKNEKEQSNGK